MQFYKKGSKKDKKGPKKQEKAKKCPALLRNLPTLLGGAPPPLPTPLGRSTIFRPMEWVKRPIFRGNLIELYVQEADFYRPPRPSAGGLVKSGLLSIKFN